MLMKNASLAGGAPIAAVQTVRVGSATISASYYFMLGMAAHPVVAAFLAIVGGALDYFKGNTLSVVFDGRGFFRRVTALAVFVILFTVSMLAIDGAMMKLRSIWASAPADVIKKHDDASKEYARIAKELEKLVDTRSTEQIRAAMESAPVSRDVFRRTKECTDITKDESFAACKPLLDLRTEMASAIHKRELEAQRDTLKGTLDKLGPRPTSADPQAEALAGILGVDAGLVSYILVVILGFAIEVVACSGSFILGRRELPDFFADVPAHGDGGEKTLPKLPEIPEGPKGEVLKHILGELRIGQSIPRQADLVEMFDIPKSTISDWLKEFERDGLIPARLQVGRCKAVVPA